MKIDGGIGFDPDGMRPQAAKAEESGYDGVWSAETSHDPFLPIAIGAAATEKLEFGTGIAVAFARNPMTLAVLANDLQLLSKGRFMLGMGSQIKPHITKRFSMPWSHPAPRMRELILAIRAIWKTWETGEQLEFRGEFYTHTLMTPFFNPGPNPLRQPQDPPGRRGRAHDRGGGRGRRRLPGPRLLHGALPARGEPARAGAWRGQGRQDAARPHRLVPRLRGDGPGRAEHGGGRQGVRQQIAFYGSTPAYRPVLELHGWGDLQPELNTLSKRGEWVKMGELIDDDVLNAFAVVAPLDQVAAEVRNRFGDIVDRFSFYAPYKVDPEDVEGRAGRVP